MREVDKNSDHVHDHTNECCCHLHDHAHESFDDCCGGEHEHEHGHVHGGCECCEAAATMDISKNSAVSSGTYGFKSEIIKHKGEITLILIGAAFFAAGFLVKSFFGLPGKYLFFPAYIILGAQVIWSALKNLIKGSLFDENFLMGIATIAAFCLGDFAEAAGVMLFYRVGEFLEELAVNQSKGQIMSMMDLRPENVLIEKDGVETLIPAKDAKVGDVIIIRPGDRIALDGTVIEGESRLDTSAVTGEAVSVRVIKGTPVMSGCVNLQGLLKIRVEKLLEESMVSRILKAAFQAAQTKPKSERFLTKFSKIYTPVVVGVAILTAVIPGLFTGNWNYWIYTAVTFLVISCPCALVLSIPLSFFAGIGAGSKRGILFKGGAAIEVLKDVKAVVMDKTGTLTKGDFKVRKVVSCGRLSEKQLLNLAADCEVYSTHPIGESIVQEARERGLEIIKPTDAKEIAGKGIIATFPEGEVLCGNAALLIENGITDLPKGQDEYGAIVYLALAGRAEGYIRIADEIKADAAESIKVMKADSLKTVMLTGDNEEQAMGVANALGIEKVYAKLLPEEKVSKIQEIRRDTGGVFYIGDGINDAPVLSGADVGAAMGTGADAALEAADVVFMTSKVSAIPTAKKIADATGRIVIMNIIFALGIKGIIMLLGFLGYASMWAAVFADTGVALICIANSVRLLYRKKYI
ncbi:MAG: heavy metal translocating P-type ATPase [Lachnospiraceae bacterium]|nr:heavy metal translocating P-type ATPase [Lachnospiraceae bacterium]